MEDSINNYNQQQLSTISDELTRSFSNSWEAEIIGETYRQQPVLVTIDGKGSRRFVCRTCNATFTTKGSLVRHNDSHIGLRPFICEQCGVSFSQKTNLIMHLRVHTGERPYDCSICGQSFSRSQHLTRHRKIHTKPKRSKKHADERLYPKTNAQCDYPETSYSTSINPETAYNTCMDANSFSMKTFPNVSQDLNFTFDYDVTDHPQKHENSYQVISNNNDETQSQDLKPFFVDFQYIGGANLGKSLAYLDQNEDASKSRCELKGRIYADQEQNCVSAAFLTTNTSPLNVRSDDELVANTHFTEEMTSGTQNGDVDNRKQRCVKSEYNLNDLSNSNISEQHISSDDACLNKPIKISLNQRNISGVFELNSDDRIIRDDCNEVSPFNCKKCRASFARKFNLILHSIKHAKDLKENIFVGNIRRLSFSKSRQFRRGENSHRRNLDRRYVCGKSYHRQKVFNRRANIKDVKNPDKLVGAVFKPSNSIPPVGTTLSENSRNVAHLSSNQLKHEWLATESDRANREFERPGYRIKTAKKNSKQQVGTENSRNARCNATGPHVCVECCVSFSSAWCLRRHISSHTGMKPFICQLCNASFKQKNNLEVHNRIHTGEKPYRCDTCGVSFARSQHLTRHKRTHARKIALTCDTCGQPFRRKDKLEEHRSIHEAKGQGSNDFCWEKGSELSLSHVNILGERVNTSLAVDDSKIQIKLEDGYAEKSLGSAEAELDMCRRSNKLEDYSDPTNSASVQESTLRNTSLGQHGSNSTYRYGEIQNNTENEYERENSALCESLDSACATDPILSATDDGLETNSPFASSAKTKPFTCDECGACFAQKGSLKAHQCLHTDQKPYACDICEASFSQRRNLVLHNRIHTGEKPYKCNVCDAFFSRAQHLTQHTRAVHPREKSYVCDICDKSFHLKKNLRRHQFLHRKSRYSCHLCGKLLRTLEDFDNHFKSHAIVRTEPSVVQKGIVLQKAKHEVAASLNHVANGYTASSTVFSKSLKFDNGNVDVQKGTVLQEAKHGIATSLNPVWNDCTAGDIMSSESLKFDNGNEYVEIPNLHNSDNRFPDQSGTEHRHLEVDKTVSRVEKLGVSDRISHTADINEGSDARAFRRTNCQKGQFVCDECNKSLTTMDGLLKHLRLHTGERPFVCSVCGVTFTQKCNLVEHARIHTGEKPYSCEECGASFARKGHMKRHLVVHSTERRFTCEFCSRTFRHRDSLTRHACPGKDSS